MIMISSDEELKIGEIVTGFTNENAEEMPNAVGMVMRQVDRETFLKWFHSQFPQFSHYTAKHRFLFYEVSVD